MKFHEISRREISDFDFSAPIGDAPWTCPWDLGFAQSLGGASSVFGQVLLAAGGANSRQVQAAFDRVPQELA